MAEVYAASASPYWPSLNFSAPRSLCFVDREMEEADADTTFCRWVIRTGAGRAGGACGVAATAACWGLARRNGDAYTVGSAAKRSTISGWGSTLGARFGCGVGLALCGATSSEKLDFLCPSVHPSSVPAAAEGSCIHLGLPLATPAGVDVPEAAARSTYAFWTLSFPSFQNELALLKTLSPISLACERSLSACSWIL